MFTLTPLLKLFSSFRMIMSGLTTFSLSKVYLNLLIFIFKCTNATLPTWIHPIQDGITISENRNAHMSAGQWTLLIISNEPSMPMEYFEFLDSFENQISKSYSPDKWLTSWLDRLTVIRRRCKTPDHWYQSDIFHRTLSRKRNKRGLLNFVGSISNKLFGIATDDEISDVHKTLEQLKSNENKIVHDVSKMISVINHQTSAILKNREQLLLLNEHFETYLNVSGEKFAEIDRNIAMLSLRHDIEVIVSHVDHLCRDFLNDFQHWLSTKENLEIGRLTESLLPPEILSGILQTIKMEDVEAVSPISWYYRTLDVLPLIVNNSLVYKVNIPLVRTDPWRFMKIDVFPFPLATHYCMIQLPDSLLHNTGTDELVLSPECIGNNPIVCYSHVIRSASDYDCARSLILSNPSYSHSCYLKFSKSILHSPKRFHNGLIQPSYDTSFISEIDVNKFILITRGITLLKRCLGTPTQSIHVPKGVFQINMKFPCSLSSKLWKIYGQAEHTTNFSLTTISNFKLPNISYMESFKVKNLSVHFENLNLPPLSLPELTIDDMMTVSLPKQPNDFNLWFIMLIGVLPILFAIIYVVYQYKKGKSKSDNGNATAESAAASQPSAPPQSAPNTPQPTRYSLYPIPNADQQMDTEV